MKIIFLERVKGTGEKFQVKEVADGYARNFLIPHGLARRATEEAVRALQEKKATWERQEAEEKLRLETLAKEWEGKELVFEVKAGEKEKVFGSVGKKDIEEKLRAAGVPMEEVMLEHPIKKLGSYPVSVHLGRGVKVTITAVVRSQP